MNGLLIAGRLFFAIAMVFFGFQFLIFVSAMRGPLPGPPWSHGVLLLDWLACVGFIAGRREHRNRHDGAIGGDVLGVVLLLYGLFRYLPALVDAIARSGSVDGTV